MSQPDEHLADARAHDTDTSIGAARPASNPPQCDLPLPGALQFLSSNKALGVFLAPLVSMLALVVALMALIEAVDPPSSTAIPSTSADTEVALDPESGHIPPNHPATSDSRITALQFIWIISPTASTFALLFALRRFKRRQTTAEPLVLEPAADVIPRNDAIAQPALAASDHQITAPSVSAPAPSSDHLAVPRPITGAAPATLGLEQMTTLEPLAHTLLQPTASPGASSTPVALPEPESGLQLYLEHPRAMIDNGLPPSFAPSFAPISLEQQPHASVSHQSDDVSLPPNAAAAAPIPLPSASPAAHDGEPGTLVNFLTVTNVTPARGMAVTEGVRPGCTLIAPSVAAAKLFAEAGADLLRRLPYLPFLGLGLPELLLDTRCASLASRQAAAARQPWYERLGLRLLLSTHLPPPSVPLRKWIFRTRYAHMKKWPRAVAFLVGAVAFPTILTSLYGLAQYLIASGSGAQGWYNDAALEQVRTQLHLSSSASPGGIILLGWVYEAIVGCWWDLMPVASADWGVGLGFSGASWIILAALEEFGWMGGLFPILYYNAQLRTASAVVTRWWYRHSTHTFRTGSNSPPRLPSPNFDLAATPLLGTRRLVATATSSSATATDSNHAPRQWPTAAPPANHTTLGHDSTDHAAAVLAGVPSTSSESASVSPSVLTSTSAEWIHATLVCLVLGFIWSAWHWPFILLRDWLPHGVGYVPGTDDTPLAYGFFMWVPRIMATRFVVVYFCLACSSYWGGLVFHAVHNVMVYSYWAILPDTDGRRYPFARYMHAESGLTVVVAYLATAAFLVCKWKRDDERRQARKHKPTATSSRTNISGEVPGSRRPSISLAPPSVVPPPQSIATAS